MNAQDFTFCTARAMVPRCRPARRPFARPGALTMSAAREAREAARRLGARAQAQPGRAPEAGEGAARDPRRAAGADRRRLRERRRGGRRPAPVVGPLPRQAEDRHVHAPREGAGRAALAARAARDRRGLEPLRQGRRRALDAAEHPAALARAREAARRLRAPRGGGHHDRRRLRRHRAQHHRLPGAGPRRRRALRLRPRSSTRPPSTSTATPTGRTCRASTSTRSPRAPTAATRRRSTASRWSAPSTTAARASPCSSAAASPRCRASRRDMGVFVPKEDANEILGAITSVWSDDLKYRVSRVKARLKFMVDDIGPEGIRERVEARLGTQARGLHAAADRGRAVAPPRRAPAEAGRPLVHRRAGPPRPDLAATR